MNPIKKIIGYVLDNNLYKFVILICPLVYLFYFIIYDLGAFFGIDIFILDGLFAWIIFIFILGLLLPTFKYNLKEEIETNF